MLGKGTRKSLPKSTKELSKEQLVEILCKKRECNTKALRIVETLCEDKVDADWLLKHLVYINQSHYDDVVTERSITSLCGYPLCSNQLGVIPKQQYRISLKYKTVYDITERKKYCSNSCYKSGEFLKNQLLTSPLWFRDSEKVPTFSLLAKENEVPSTQEEANNDDNAEREGNLSESDVESSNVIEPVYEECSDKGSEIEIDNKGDEEPLIGAVENKYRTEQIGNASSEEGKVDEDSVEKVERAIDDWINLETLIYLLGEDAVREKLEDNKAVFSDIVKNPSMLTPLHKKFDELAKVFSLLNIDFDSSENRDLKPLPDYSVLKAEAENLTIKVRAYFAGQLEVAEDSSSEKKDNEERVEDGEENRFTMPLVDSHAQNALRRRVLLDKLNRMIPDVCLSMESPGTIVMADVRGLVNTFSLSPHNVMFRPREMYLVSLILIKLLSLKKKEIENCFLQSLTKKRITLLLMSYNLPADYLDNVVVWLTDSEHLLQKFQC